MQTIPVPIPIINNLSGNSSSCGHSCGCSTDDAEFATRLQELQRDLAHSWSSERKPVVASPNEVAPSSLDQQTQRLRFSYNQALPLVKDITRREIDGKYLWVGVSEAAVSVFGAEDACIADQLASGVPPRSITLEGYPAATVWEMTAGVIGQLARRGFLEGVKGYVEDRPSSPHQFARFHLTKACQLECIHCYAESGPSVRRDGELPTARWQTLAEAFIRNGGKSVLFTGGEALLHSGCLEIMRMVRELGANTTLFTNGLLVPKYAKEIHELASSVQVSLDGPDALSNDAIRGKNTYHHIRRAIDILVAQGTPTRVGMSVMLSNWKAWKEQFLSFAEQYSGTSLEFRLSFGLTHYGRAKALEPIAVDDVQPLAFSFMEQVNGSTGAKITRTTKGCGYCEQLVVGPDGRVYPCHLLDAPICHIDDYRLPELIDVLRRFGRMFDVDHVDGCSTCDIRYLCGGTCRVMNHEKTGSRFATTCNPQEKERKVRNLLRTYSN